MSTNVVTAAPDRGRGARWASLGGIVYVVLFIVGSIVALDGPTSDEPPAKFISYYGDSGHRDRISVGWVLAMLGVLCFLWFLARLRESVVTFGNSFLSTLVLIGGVFYALTTAVGFSIWMAISTMSDDTYLHAVFPPLIHAASDAGYIIHSAGGVGAATMIVAASLAALRAGRVAGWVGWTGIVLGVIGLFSILFFPQLAIAIWLVAASVFLLRERPVQGAQSAPR
jgi:hypothetical protein